MSDGWDGPGNNNGVTEIGYHLAVGTDDLPNEKAIIELALGEWAAHAPIQFVERPSAGHPDSIDFYFSMSLGFPHFVNSDGPFETLGYGFFPDDLNSNPLAGDVFFDEAETWTAGTSGIGTCGAAMCDLFYVAVHEIGHALGLDHISNVENNPAELPSVMTPFFTPTAGSHPGFGRYDTLQAADITALQSVYGMGSGGVVPISQMPEPTSALLLGLGLGCVALVRRGGAERG